MTNDGWDAVRWVAADDVRTLVCESGTLLIEGGVFEVEGENGPAALRRLAALIDREGPAALAKADGDFVACLIAPREVHAFKSFTSQYQLYYRDGDRRISNRLGDFFDSRSSRWSEDYFAQHVLIVPGYQFFDRGTPLAGVSRVLPGELVSIGVGVRRAQLVTRDYRYRLDPAQKREEIAPRILDVLRRSIRNRLAAYGDAGICIEISGGLDSSFIACLVGEQRASGVRGVMFSQPKLPTHAISEGYAREVAERYGIDLVVMPPQDIPPVPDTEPAYSDEPSDFFWFGDMFSKAVARVADPDSLVFTGFGADQLFLRNSSFLPYLLRRGEVRLFLQALGPVSDLMSRGRANLGWQSVLSLMPDGLHQRLIMAFAGKLWNPWDVSDVDMARMLTNPVPWLRGGQGLEAYTQQRLAREAELVGDGVISDDWGYFSAPRAVTQPHFAAKRLVDASPFCDLPLLDVMYNDVSALLVHDFKSRYKELLRECQQGIVPESLRARRNDTFVFNSFQLNYVQAARGYFESLLGELPDAWADKAAIRQALEELMFGIATSSTRSVTAMMGYLGWRRSFIGHAASLRGAKTGGIFSAQVAASVS